MPCIHNRHCIRYLLIFYVKCKILIFSLFHHREEPFKKSCTKQYNAIPNRSKIRICIQQNLLELKNMSLKILFSLYFFMLFMIFKKNHITKHHFNKSVKLTVYTIHDVKWVALYCQIKLPKYSHISSLIVPNLQVSRDHTGPQMEYL